MITDAFQDLDKVPFYMACNLRCQNYSVESVLVEFYQDDMDNNASSEAIKIQGSLENKLYITDQSGADPSEKGQLIMKKINSVVKHNHFHSKNRGWKKLN